jgi:hypothetical protein
MKNIFVVIFFMCSVSSLFIACSKSDTGSGSGGTVSGGGGITFSCVGITPKFSTDIQPILNTVCSNNSACHAVGSINSGGVLTTHAEVFAKRSNIRVAILSGAMPKNTTLSQAQINAFLCWIDNGAPNN